MDKIIPIVFSVNKNFLYPLKVVMQSLKSTKSKDYTLDIYVFNTELSEMDFEVFSDLVSEDVKISNVNVAEFMNKGKFYNVYKYSLAMYYRFFIPEILTQYDKALYLDVDIIVKRDVSELFNIDVTDYLLAGVGGFSAPELINSGVLLLNLDNCRKENFSQKCIDFINKNQSSNLPDQDAINSVASGKIKYISRIYNHQLCALYDFKSWKTNPIKSYKNAVRDLGINEKDVVVVHFTYFIKPWVFDNLPYAKLWWKNAKKLQKKSYRNLIEFCNKSRKEYFKEKNIRETYKRINPIYLFFSKLKRKYLNKK